MNTKPLLQLSCILAIAVVTASTAVAGPHRRTNNNFNSTRRAPVRQFAGANRIAGWNAQHWNRRNFVGGQHWNGAHWNSWNWHHHRHFRDFVFFDVGFPFWGWWGYPYYYDYYPYGYSGGGYYGGYNSGYNRNYGSSYGSEYENGSNVTELQRKLADAGYYHGPIDGIMGSRTYYALKAYRHDHGNGKNINGGYSPTLRDRPYSPPPITKEPDQPEE